MATHGEIRWPSVGTFDGRLRGDSHGRRQAGTGRPTWTPAKTARGPASVADRESGRPQTCGGTRFSPKPRLAWGVQDRGNA
jgi:hypothetical protein